MGVLGGLGRSECCCFLWPNCFWFDGDVGALGLHHFAAAGHTTWKAGGRGGIAHFQHLKVGFPISYFPDVTGFNGGRSKAIRRIGWDTRCPVMLVRIGDDGEKANERNFVAWAKASGEGAMKSVVWRCRRVFWRYLVVFPM